MSEIETPPVTEEAQLATVRTTGSILERWIEGTPEAAMAKLDALTRILERMRQAAVQQTYPSDWVIHTTVDKGTGDVIKQVGYLQDSGAERAGKIFGIEVGQPAIQREDFPEDRTFAYHMSADAWSKITGERIERVEGSRASSDPFFKPKNEEDKVDPTDVRKAAYANLHGRAVRSLTGLSAVPLDVLKAMGLDTNRCLFVSYSGGAKGGTSAGAQLGGVDVTVAFGRSKGKKPAELEDADLAWCIKAYSENVQDPAKATYVKANQRVLDALRAEDEKRKVGRAHDNADAAGEDTTADGKPTPIGTLRGTAWTMLQDAAGKRAPELLRLITKDKDFAEAERGAPSECTEAELNKIIGLGAEALKTMAGQLPKAK